MPPRNAPRCYSVHPTVVFVFVVVGGVVAAGLLHGDALELRVQQCPGTDSKGRRAPRQLPHLEEGLLAEDGLHHHR